MTEKTQERTTSPYEHSEPTVDFHHRSVPLVVLTRVAALVGGHASPYWIPSHPGSSRLRCKARVLSRLLQHSLQDATGNSLWHRPCFFIDVRIVP
jgi:hypothetical protein